MPEKRADLCAEPVSEKIGLSRIYNNVLVSFFVLLFFVFFPLQANASWAASSRFVPLTSLTGDCVMDSITVNGVTVNAVYNYPKKMSDRYYREFPKFRQKYFS